VKRLFTPRLVRKRTLFGAAVYAVLTDGDKILLMRRAGSGYHDGELGLPAGHLDGGEDALTGLCRELREELTIDVDPDACTLAIVLHRAAEPPHGHEYLDLVFTVDSWRGAVSIGEPAKCDELVWADRDALPADVVPYVATTLDALRAGERLLLIGWPETSHGPERAMRSPGHGGERIASGGEPSGADES
jgi:8-oxo-dGTP diphosphatase